jgi:carbon monoxide dehydrogenase subunit G
MKVERTVTIDRASADVFSFLSDLENHVLFVPGLQEFRLVTEMGPGAQAVGVRRALGRVRRLPYRVTTFVPDHAIGVSTRLGPLEGTADYRVEATPEGRTRVTMTNDFRAVRPFGILDPILNKMARHDAEVVLHNLKRRLEASPG